MRRFLTLALLAYGILLQAQEFKTNIQLNAGVSLVGRIFESADDFGGDIKTYSTPAFQLNVDRKLANWFSLGFASSFQMMGAKYSNYTHTNNGQTESFENDVTRLNLAIRSLFHYGRGEQLNFYSGLRYGLTKWNVETTSSNSAYNASSSIGGDLTNYGIQIVLFGIQGYFNDHVGVNAEFCLGSPHYLSMGLSYRF